MLRNNNIERSDPCIFIKCLKKGNKDAFKSKKLGTKLLFSITPFELSK